MSDNHAWQQEQWKKIAQFQWMTPEAWAEIERPDIKESLGTWLQQSAGNPCHNRLLLHAIHARCICVVRALLAAGASPHPQPYDDSPEGNQNFWSPLCTAVSASHYPYDPRLFDMLLDAGADPRGCLPTSSSRNRSVVASAIDDPVAMADMLGRGFEADLLEQSDRDRLNRDKQTALQHAAQDAFDKHTPRRHRRNVVRQLIQAGADIDRPDEQGRTPLMLALRRAPFLVGPLLAGFARTNCQDHDGRGLHAVIEQLRDEGQERLSSSLAKRLSRMELGVMQQATPGAGSDRQVPRL